MTNIHIYITNIYVFITNRTSDDLTDSIGKVIEIYGFQPSIILIHKHLEKSNKFSFETVSISHTENEINNFNTKKQV